MTERNEQTEAQIHFLAAKHCIVTEIAALAATVAEVINSPDDMPEICGAFSGINIFVHHVSGYKTKEAFMQAMSRSYDQCQAELKTFSG